MASLEKFFQLWNIPCSTRLPENMENEEPKIALVDCKEEKIIDQLSHKGTNPTVPFDGNLEHVLVVMGYPSQLRKLSSNFSTLKKPIRRSELICMLTRLLVREIKKFY